MKMNRQNPGGEIEARPTMKGCEFGIGKGKSSVLGGTLQTKYGMNAPGMQGMAKSHKLGSNKTTAGVGSTITGTSKACRD